MTKLSDFPLQSAAPDPADAVVGVTAGNLDVRYPYSLLTSLKLNTQTGNYTLVLTDAGKWVEMNVATANTLTIPPNSSVAFPLNTVVTVVQIGAGITNLVAGAGVTLLTSGGATHLNGQYSSVTLYKRAPDTWVALGALA
jgi:hypothetical protein